ncbi:type I CRISPR-associated protein Cas7 [Sediminispirochaeta bajacaliforniensis]|uniref:type I CRISPR-associated protein Cas7 n=1 Tax=Sediminispirochaeta bajacaliforniensis TaxID=148 RepID=UPI0003752DD6|nr:type I CRISPR-associated protein Cas7 [Sediminispirochaeta bajacaliforniensis]
MKAEFNRHVGLLVLDVTMSNPNGDPDMESEPRTRELDGLGMISPVSLKRKFRDLVGEESEVFNAAKEKLNLGSSTKNSFRILEERGRDRDEIKSMNKELFQKMFWDARLFGNTFLESLKDSELDAEQKEKKKAGGYNHLINTGAMQIGVGLSVAPIDVVRMTNTNKSGVEADKDRGMAPLAFRVVQHGIYTIPIFVNPSIAQKTGATAEDLELFKFILPYVYQHTASAIRPQISILHAWFAEHKNALGSCPEHLFIKALTPKVKEEIKEKVKNGVSKPSSMEDYYIPSKSDLGDLMNRFNKVEDLMENI